MPTTDTRLVARGLGDHPSCDLDPFHQQHQPPKSATPEHQRLLQALLVERFGEPRALAAERVGRQRT